MLRVCADGEEDLFEVIYGQSEHGGEEHVFVQYGNNVESKTLRLSKDTCFRCGNVASLKRENFRNRVSRCPRGLINRLNELVAHHGPLPSADPEPIQD